MHIVASIKNKDEKFVGKNHVIQEPTVMHFNFHKKMISYHVYIQIDHSINGNDRKRQIAHDR